MRRIVAFMLAIAILFPFNLSYSTVYAFTDDYILNDNVNAVYQGRDDAADIVENLNFTDVPAGHWAKEVIAKGGALNLIKGYGTAFRPEASVTKQEAVAFALRVIGYEQAAVALGETLAATLPDSGALELWSLGYLNYAAQLGFISWADYQNALVSDQTTLAEDAFHKNDPATREEVADWIYLALNYIDSTIFNPVQPVQKVLTFKDWQSIGADKVTSVEGITSLGIMNGDNNDNFRPKNRITRAEMAQVLANMDSVYFDIMRIAKRIGTVGVIRDSQYSTTNNQEVLWRYIYVRTEDGTMDVLQYETTRISSPQAKDKDAVVYGLSGKVSGLGELQEGDIIEYLVHPEANTVLYVKVAGRAQTTETQGALYQINPDVGIITIEATDGNQYIYSIIEGLVTTENGVNYILMDDKKYDVTKMPYGSKVKLTLIGDVVKEINFVGESVLIGEIRGIVVENNPQYGYITIIDNNGNKVTKNYYENNLVVEKQQHYDIEDEIGYIDQVFPNFNYDPRDTVISAIEPGDVVFIRTSASDPNSIESISASTNYIMRYGKINQITNNGDYFEVLLEYENKQTSWFDLARDIFITKQGKLIDASDIKVGDWAKVLVNEAIIEPGYVIESVKEMTVEGDAHYISNIVKGSLSGMNAVQNQLLVEGAEILTKTGWDNYRDLQPYSISGGDIEYYYNGERISRDYAMRYFSKGNAMVYIALENNYAGERVKKVTFRINRDEVLSPDTVVYADGSGAFALGGYFGNIATDGGTIVRRYGRLVSGQDVLASDYITVALNGGNYAAVIDIVDAPDTSEIMVARGRVLSVNDKKSFKVQSMSMLSGTTWVYTPVQREFSIDNKTMFLNEDGYVDSSTFLSYTESSVVDKVYNIITDGSRASYVIESPYANQSVRGTIYSIENGTFYLKDAYVQDQKTGKWSVVSNTNNTLTAVTQANTIIGKNNQIVLPSSLVVGDQIRIMTDSLPAKVTSATEVTAYIIMVEK